LGEAVDGFRAEISRQLPEKTSGPFRSYLAILLEHLGPERRLGTVTKQEASDVKKLLQILPTSQNTTPHLKGMSLSPLCQGCCSLHYFSSIFWMGGIGR